MKPVIRVENLSKSYRLGQITGGMLSEDLNRWWARWRGLPDPYLKIGQKDHGNRHGEYVWALKDVSFSVDQGEVLGIIGSNGAGKSTLLKILSRVTAPTSGRIRVRGRVASLLEVGTGFHPDLTGRENIYLNGAILGMKKSEITRKFGEIVDFAEVEKFIDTPVKRYSSGMYVRLAFAVAAHLEPEILIVDEVLAVGDAEFQKKCLGKIGDVAHEGRTVLFVSHNMAAIRSICNRGLWIDHGGIVLFGDVGKVVSEYLNRSSQDSIESKNLEGIPRVNDLGKKIRLTQIDFNNNQPVVHGEFAIIQIEYNAFQFIDSIAFGIGFNSIEGTRILSLDSDLSFNTYNLETGKGRLTIKIDQFFLQPGRYSVDVGVRSSSVGLDVLLSFMQIDVLPGPKTPPPMVRADGGVRLPANWVLIQNMDKESESLNA